MGTKRVGWARIKSLINENTNALKIQRNPIKVITTDTVLTAADSGKIIFLDANDIEVTLPHSVSLGMNFRVIMADNYDTAASTVTSSADSVTYFRGAISTSTSDHLPGANPVAGTSDNYLGASFGATSVAGDWIEFIGGDSNTNSWFVSGHVSASNGVTFSV